MLNLRLTRRYEYQTEQTLNLGVSSNPWLFKVIQSDSRGNSDTVCRDLYPNQCRLNNANDAAAAMNKAPNTLFIALRCEPVLSVKSILAASAV